MDKRVHNVINTPTNDLPDYEGPLCAIKLLEGGAESMCGGTVSGGVRLCMTRS